MIIYLFSLTIHISVTMSEEENLAKVDAGEDGDDGDNGPAPVSK